MVNFTGSSTFSRAIIFTDQTINHSGVANGGTGKSLLMKGISKLMNTVIQDGKNLKSKNNFQFQRVRNQTEILYLDDVREDYPFESLYSIITAGITVERKYATEEHIPYEEAPKVVISSNYVVKGTGGNTDRRRRVDFEVSDYYRLNSSPEQEFGKQFFTDWEDVDWNNFYVFMIRCVQLYLKEGLIMPRSINLEKNTVLSKSCPQFYEFAETELIKEGRLYKDELLEKFNAKYKGFEQVPSNTFTKWINAWEEYQCKSLKIEQKQSNGRSLVVISCIEQ